MIKAERAWVEFRKDHCEFEASLYDGGTFAPIAIDDCFAQLTAERANTLREDLPSAEDVASAAAATPPRATSR